MANLIKKRREERERQKGRQTDRAGSKTYSSFELIFNSFAHVCPIDTDITFRVSLSRFSISESCKSTNTHSRICHPRINNIINTKLNFQTNGTNPNKPTTNHATCNMHQPAARSIETRFTKPDH